MSEGCIAQCYVAEEVLEYCAEHIDNLEAIGVPKNRNERSKIDINRHGIGDATVTSVGLKELQQAHLYVLENIAEVNEYIEYVLF